MAAAAANPSHRSWLSATLLLWLQPIVSIGWRGGAIDDSKVAALPEGLSSRDLRAKAMAAGSTARTGSELRRALLADHRSELILGVGTQLVNGAIVTVLRPLLLRDFLRRIGAGEPPASLWPLVLVMILSVLVEGLTAMVGRHILSDRIGTAMLVELSLLVQEKSLRLSASAGHGDDSAPGTLIGNDIVRLYDSGRLLALFPQGVAGLIGGVTTILLTTGAAGGFGIASICVLLCVNFRISNLAKKAEKKDLEAADYRLAIVRRLIYGIKAIKSMAWEEKMEQDIRAAREDEVKHLFKFRALSMSGIQVGRAAPTIGAATTFISFALMNPGQRMEPPEVFSTISVFMALRIALIMIPASFTIFHAMMLSMDRAAAFLARPECAASEPGPAEAGSGAAAVVGATAAGFGGDGNDSSAQSTAGDSTIASAEGEWFASSGATFAWSGTDAFVDGEGFQLTGITIEPVKAGEMVAICGPVGAGKSSLLAAMLGELTLLSGEVQSGLQDASIVSLIPQTAFIESVSIRMNILAGIAHDIARYAAAVKGSQLDADLSAMKDGDQTLIGERGVTLSGGQKARICIARALYARPSFLLADDPIAAVDVEVGVAIMDTFGALRDDGVAVVVVLNQPHQLSRFDRVICLDKGAIVEQGTYSELSALECGAFATLVEELALVDRDHTESPPLVELVQAGAASDVAMAAAGGAAAVPAVAKGGGSDIGAVSSHVFKAFVSAAGRNQYWLSVVVCAVNYGFMGAADKFLSMYADPDSSISSPRFVQTYSALQSVYCIGILLTSIWFARLTARAGATLHHDVIGRLCRAPVAWFDATPSGQITSRLSSDLSQIDLVLGNFLDNGHQFFFILCILLVVVCWAVPIVAVIVFPAALAYAVAVVAVDRTNRQIKRKSNEYASLPLTLINECIDGRVTLRRSKAALRNSNEKFDEALDQWACFNFTSSTLINGSIGFSYFVSFWVTAAASLAILKTSDGRNSADVGLAMSYSFVLPYFLLHFSYIISQVKTALTSLERLLQYSDSLVPGEEGVPQEDAWKRPGDAALIEQSWPSDGSIVFDNVSLRYKPELPLALKEVSMHVAGSEKIGVCGRSGAGKTSLITLLFRLMQPTSGAILIDGVDIATIGLHTLRKRLSVIPQVPILIQGTVRLNLSPFKEHDDAQMRKVLDQVGLSDLSLDVEVGSNASGLSAGQRQLLSFARLLLRDVKVVLLDEPTSNVDAKTDQLVQNVVVKELLRDATVITVAHRLPSIVDSDRVIVMGEGQVLEIGEPRALLATEGSRFRQLWLAGYGEASLQNVLNR